MPNEMPPVAEAPPVTQNEPIQPLNQGLDDELSKFFKTSTSDEPKLEEPKKTEPEVKAEPRVEKEPDQKQEPKKETKAPVAEKPVLTPEQVDKLDPKEKGAWGAVKNANKKAHDIIVEREAEISRLKAVVAERGQMSQKEVEALKAENSELAKYRAMIDIQADPEFLSKYDHPIEKTAASIKSMLQDMNVSKDIIDQVDFTNTKLMDEIISHVGEHKDKFVARKLERKVEELVALTDQRNETLAEQKDKYKETLEARKKQAFEKDAEGEGRAFKHLENVVMASKDKDGNPLFSFLNKKQIGDGATQPEIDQINSHNKLVEFLHGKVNQAFKMNEPEEKMEVAVAAASAHYYHAQNKALASQVRSLQEEIKKMSAVTTETEKTKTPTRRTNENGHMVSLDEALVEKFGRR